MQDIKLKILDVLRTDATLQGLVGGTPSDPRVYVYYQGDAEITPAKPGFVTISNTATPEATQAVESPIFSVMIWTRRWDRCEAIRDRIRALVHKTLVITSTGRKLYLKIVNEVDSYQHQPQYAGKTLHIRAGSSTV